MPFLSDLGTVTVTGSFYDLATNTPLEGSVTFSPVGIIKRATGGALLLPSTLVAPVSNGQLSVQLPVTDDPDYTPGFYYQVVERLPSAQNRAPYSLVIPSSLAGGTIDIVDAASLAPPVITGGRIPLNVLLYGAKGDGIANDTAAIQAALDAVPSGGGAVYIPTGVYRVNPAVGLVPQANTILFGDGYSSVLRIADGQNATGNLLRATHMHNGVIRDIRLDGNRSHQTSGNNYGLFLDSCTNARVERVMTHSFTGVGFQAYNCDGAHIEGCSSWDNLYHGFENEQCRGATWTGNHGFSNDRHGMFVSPGEVGGSGSLNNQIVANSFRSNSQYGLSIGEDAGGLSAYLSTGNVIAHNDVRANTQYGIQLWKVNGNVVVGNTVSANGFFGIHVYQSAENRIAGNTLAGNSQAADNAWDEVMLEGYADNSAHPARSNQVVDNTFRLVGANKARYCVNEGNPNDGPNIVTGNVVAGTPSTAAYHIQNSATVQDQPAGVAQVYGGQVINGANGGVDNAFNILRLYSNLANPEIQVVSSGGSGRISMWTNGGERLTIDSAGGMKHQGAQLGFYGSGPVNKPTVTGSRSANAALASLLTALANLGLVVDSTT